MISIQIVFPQIEIQVMEEDKNKGVMLAQLIERELKNKENLDKLVAMVDEIKMQIFERSQPK